MRFVRVLLLTAVLMAPGLTHAGGAPVVPPAMVHPPTPKPSTTPAPPFYSVLEFTITTGGDDLRGSSGADAQISNSGPPALSLTCHLKQTSGDAWDEKSTHTVPCELGQGWTIGYLKKSSVLIRIVERPGYMQSWDNWNIQKVVITAYQPGSGRKQICLFDVSGNPLVRLTQDSQLVRVTDFPSRC